jgi:hypothetical protein
MTDAISEEPAVLTLAIQDMSFSPWQAQSDTMPPGTTPAQAYNAQRNYWMNRLQEEEPWSLGIFVENYPPRTDVVGGIALGEGDAQLGPKTQAVIREAGIPLGAPELTPAGLRVDVSDHIRKLIEQGTLKSVSVTEQPTPLTKRESILHTANDIIHGDREKDYGSPVDSFTRLAEALNLVLRPKLAEGVELDAVDAAVLMIAMKLSRLAGGDRKDDTWVDLAGYSALGAEVRDAL